MIKQNSRHIFHSNYIYFQIEKLEETMAKENIPEDFELYKLIALLKKNDHILSDVSFTR